MTFFVYFHTPEMSAKLPSSSSSSSRRNHTHSHAHTSHSHIHTHTYNGLPFWLFLSVRPVFWWTGTIKTVTTRHKSVAAAEDNRPHCFLDGRGDTRDGRPTSANSRPGNTHSETTKIKSNTKKWLNRKKRETFSFSLDGEFSSCVCVRSASAKTAKDSILTKENSSIDPTRLPPPRRHIISSCLFIY